MTPENTTSTFPPPEDHLVIEELPAEFDIEDPSDPTYHGNSLPHVDEYKANNNISTDGHSKKSMLYAVGVVSILILTIIGVSVGSGNKNKASSDESSQPARRTHEIELFLFENQISTLPQLQDSGSSHHQASAFVADADALQLETTPEQAPKLIERYILALIYYHFGGPSWNYDLKFLSAVDHCEWNEYFTTTSGKTIRQGVFCDADGYVTALDLSWNNLVGDGVPPEIAHLANLETLHMYYNTIGGDFPSSFRRMKNLKSLALMKTGLEGRIPEWIGEMTQLTTLALGENKMLGEIPASVENLHDLTLLGLDSNSFTGNIDVLKQLQKLEALYLESNALTGDLANSNWPVLAELDASNNMLDGNIPNGLFNRETLQVLDLHGNVLGGEFPNDMFDNDVLQFVAVNNNLISGTVSDRLGFLKNLMHLDFSFNRLSGVVPDTLTVMTNLQYLASSGNNFAPRSIMDLSKLTNLRELSMKDNNIIGSIPNWIGDLSSLQLLDLDANGLTGAIPSTIGNLENMTHLLLNRNELTGTIPSEVQSMTRLSVVLLDSNEITGNANAICDSPVIKPAAFVADCYPGENGQSPEVECRCCTQCCSDDDPDCNTKTWTRNFDSSYKYGLMRQHYNFDLANAPAGYADASDINDLSTLDGGLRL